MRTDFSFFAYPKEALGFAPEQGFILCLDDPVRLSEDGWDAAARIAALLPQAKLVFRVAPEAVADKAGRAALRQKISAAFAPHGTPLTRCAVCVFAADAIWRHGLMAHALCALRLAKETSAPERIVSGMSADGIPLIETNLPQAVRESMRVNADGTVLADQDLSDPLLADAIVELVLNVAARSVHGQELAALLPHCRAENLHLTAENLSSPLLLDLTADEDATVEISFTAASGETRAYTTTGLDVRGQVDAFYGRHRSGWAYVTDILRHIHNPSAPYFETFTERRFSWGAWMGENLGPILKPWIGIVHVPLEIPHWFGQSNVFTEIAKTPSWQLSAPYCRGLFTLSRSLLESLRTVPELAHLPMDVLLHPTEFVASAWSPERYLHNPRRAIVQIGSTYRNLHGIHCVPPGPYQKWLAMGGSAASFKSLYAQEEAALVAAGRYEPGLDAGTVYLDFLDDAAYDAVFTENVIFAEYYAASATNSVLECIARHTPMLVNPLPAIVEYLGEDYPLYFTSYEEAGAKAADANAVLAAHEYLAAMDKTRFTREFFLESILNSNVYREAACLQ